MEVKYTKNHFQKVKDVIWDDVIDQMSHEFDNRSHKLLVEDLHIPPTIVLHDSFHPGTIDTAYNEVRSQTGVKELHLYISFAKNSSTFGRHKDTMDVLIVQSIGSILYAFDDNQTYELNPGDSIFIPKGVYHTPFTSGPRVTLSFSW